MIVKNCAEGDWIVEIGGFLGKSTCYLGNRIHAAGARIRVLCVDPWPANWVEDKRVRAVDPYDLWRANVKQSGWEDFIFPLRTTSAIAATIVKNGLGAVYIDGDHAYESVKQDIAAWLPKIRKGGILAGHDYGAGWAGVKKAVDEVLGKTVGFMRQSWIRKVS
jgi:predicted O-methyltransferase YrrM